MNPHLIYWRKLPKGRYYSNEVIHIFSVSVFDVTPQDEQAAALEEMVREAQHFREIQRVNNFDEELDTCI